MRAEAGAGQASATSFPKCHHPRGLPASTKAEEQDQETPSGKEGEGAATESNQQSQMNHVPSLEVGHGQRRSMVATTERSSCIETMDQDGMALSQRDRAHLSWE
jgi:hypothetical protein